MAATVEAVRVGTRNTSRRRGFVAKVAGAVRRWGERGQLGSSDLEMRLYTGAR